MNFIYLDTRTIQQLIMHNKRHIKELQTEADYLHYLIAEKYWPNSNPNDLGVISQKSYEMLNRAKNDLSAIKKKLKLLAEFQYACKYSIR